VVTAGSAARLLGIRRPDRVWSGIVARLGAGVGGQPGMVAGQPLTEPQPGGREVGGHFLFADLVVTECMRPHPAVGVVFDHEVDPLALAAR
jgi:hypothetical protein